MPSVSEKSFGLTASGQQIRLFTLANVRGMTARITNYGALLTELHVPDRQGIVGDVVLGFDSLQRYLQGHPYFGCTTGRFANRIARGRFTLNGQLFQRACNNGVHHLHGGLIGLDKRVWEASPSLQPEKAGLSMRYLSPDGEEGYPGNLDIQVIYTLTDLNELQIEYRATTDRSTPVNLTNHSYFNLTDGGRCPVLDHVLEIMSDSFTPVDDSSIPTGEIKPVDAVMSFQTPTSIGARIHQLPGNPGGYDHNYVLRKSSPGALELAARVYSPASGRVLEILTTQPGIQLYTGNYLDGSVIGKLGAVYQQRHGLCLETQHFPDSVNHPQFPSTILQPGATYHQITVHRFRSQTEPA